MNKSKEVVYLETLIGREASAVSAKLGAEEQLEKQKLVQTLGARSSCCSTGGNGGASRCKRSHRL